ncbi:hypothetical protein EYC80_002611 [Monilinia laxa]|uniref:Uncharacterized protein n=1 Tax=Monilinia laxa TaxID=61186 RepID=A0A5N6K573_MONLA|nr:hypothetical protein EYC80_002611 [Monilinia laxa]
MGPESMFSNNWFSSFKSWREVHGSEDNGPVPYFWVRNTLKQLTNTYPTDDLAEYYLAFEWTNEPNTIKKVAKALIKQHSSSLKLYNAYAMIEWSKGNQEISNGIYTAALGMSKSMSSDNNNKKDSIYLWKSLIWANLSTGLKETALSHLLSIPDGIPSPDIPVELTPTTLLKAQQHLSSARDHFLTVNNATYAVLYTELLALFKYLTTTSTTAPHSPQQGNITSALEILTTFSTQLSSRLTTNSKSTYPQTLLHQSTARLLHHHAKSGPYRPQTLHEYLTKSLRLFPSNTIFFCLLTSPGLGMTRLLSPIAINTLFGELLDSSSTHHNLLPLYLHILHHHLQHSQSPTPNINTINSTFISALGLKNKNHKSTSELSSSPSLWKLYLLFLDIYPQFFPTTSSSLTSKTLLLTSNHKQNDRETSAQKAKGMLELWKQAIAKIPWCKSIYMLGFEMLTKDDDSSSDTGENRATENERDEQRTEEIERQLQHIWRVMGEKEIRVHIDLEGVWDAEE